MDADYSVSYTVRSLRGVLVRKTDSGNYSHTKCNAAEIRKNITWGVGHGTWFNLSGWISSAYTGTHGGETLSCSTYVSR